MSEHKNYLTDAAVRTLVGVVRKVQQLVANLATRVSALESNHSRPGLAPTWFRNDSSETIPAYAVVANNGLVTPGSGVPAGLVSGIKPSTTYSAAGYFLNGPRDLGPGESAKIQRGDYQRAAHDSGWSPVKGDGGGPKPGSWLLWKGYPALVSVGGVMSADDDILLGTLSPITTLLCKASADLSVGSVSTNFKIWSGTVAGGADAGFTTLPAIEIGAPYKNNDFFVAHRVNNGWISGYPSKSVTVVTDEQVDGATRKLQKKTRTIYVLAADAESSWTDVHTGVECP